MGLHGFGIFCLYYSLMLLFQLHTFRKYVLCIFSFLGLSQQNFKVSPYVAQAMFHPSHLVTQCVYIVAYQLHPSEVLHKILVYRYFGLRRCPGWSLEQILCPTPLTIFTLITRVRAF